MTDTEKLYETLGELLYAIAMADGAIQKEEHDAMQHLLHNHTWAETINWSFEYETKKESDVKEIYHKVISFCKNHGPSPLYGEFIEAMKIISEASNGIDQKENKMITCFSNDLIKQFRKDLGID